MLALGPVLLRCPQGGAGDSNVREGCTETMQETVNEKENMVETPDSLDAAAFEEAGIVSGQTGHKSPESKTTNQYLTNEPPAGLVKTPCSRYTGYCSNWQCCRDVCYR